MTYSIHRIEQSRGDIVVTVREWDGIDRPDYLNLDGLSPGQARSWADQLTSSAVSAEAYLEEQAQTTFEEKRSQLERLKIEVASLEAEVGDA